MAQQVIHVRYHLPSQSPLVDTVSFGMTYEKFGASPTGDVPGLLSSLATKFLATYGSYKMMQFLAPSLVLGGSGAWIGATDVTAHLAGTPAGPEAWTVALPLTSVAGMSAGPEGVACKVTYQCDYGSDPEFAGSARPRASDRNGFYLGPLGNNAIQADTNGRGALASSFLNLISTWLTAISAGPGTSPDIFGLVVWSKKRAQVIQAIKGWVDDRPDYQRRRADQGANRTYIPSLQLGTSLYSLEPPSSTE